MEPLQNLTVALNNKKKKSSGGEGGRRRNGESEEEEATIECPAEGDYPIRVRWTRNGMPIQADARMKVRTIGNKESREIDAMIRVSLFPQIKEERTRNGLLSRLVIRNLRSDDSAVFDCYATNQYGKSQRTVNLIVQVISFSL